MTMVVDHGKRLCVDTISISRFKATCLAALERVHKTGRPLRVTRFGKPVADVVPPSVEAPGKDWLGCLQGTIRERGDIVGPTSDLAAWDTLR